MKDRRRAVFWTLLVSGLCAFALAMGYRWFERGGAFDLDTVRIRGIRSADSAVVCNTVKPLFGTSIWKIDPGALQRELVALPGIDSASVSRMPLSTIILDIRVSTPSFAVMDTCGIHAVSDDGEPLPDRFLSDSLPVVEATVPMGQVAARSIACWLDGSTGCSDSLKYIFDEKGMCVQIDPGHRVLLGTSNLPERWNRFLAMEGSMYRIGDFGEVDMRYSGQAILRNSSVAAGLEVPR